MVSNSFAIEILTLILISITGFYAWQMKKQVNATVEMAKTTEELANKDRRQRYLEIKLKDVYSPLFHIFSLAKNSEEYQREANRKIAGMFVFMSDELPKIKEIYRDSSHYMNEKLREIIYREIIEEPDILKEKFTPDELDSAFEEIISTYYDLKTELEQLSIKVK